VVVVDSSVWIDFFSGRSSAPRLELRRLLYESETRVIVPDMVLFEVLRGFRDERDLRLARSLMRELAVESSGGEALALAAAEHYRTLRARGITIRSAIDVLIATFCIEHDYLLLHNDRDFDAFAEHRGLRVWQH
jgi:predicted nucleic acid-binding protein